MLYQSAMLENLKDQRSFGFWSARRCDVYIVSFEPGHLHERMEVATLLWKSGITADLSYEKGIESSVDAYVAQCTKEGIL